MSAFSVSDLLNPAPLSHPGSPQHNDSAMMEEYESMKADEKAADNHNRPQTTIANDIFAPELFQTDSMNDAPSIFDQQGILPMDQSSSPEFMRKDSVTTDMLHGMDTIMEDDSMITESARKKERSTKQRDPDKLKDTKHSSKNEGQHTDRRYLCYICHKLFTRRRSVRDHLNKIHGEKTWEPQKSLEVVVEPHSGEPIEPIEEIIARGPPPPPPKPAKASKSQKSESFDGENGQNAFDQSFAHNQDMDEPTQEMSTSHAPEHVLHPKPAVMPQIIAQAALEIQQDQKQEPEPELEVEPEIPKFKKEESLQTESQAPSRPTSVEPSQPAPIVGKKRPFSMTKKGTAKVKSSTPSKRLKLTDSERSTPARSPSVTPAQRPGSKLKKPMNVASPSSRASSRQPSPSPTPSVATPASSNDDGEIFCICRKGDNHTWMIACDGPCEEWFHGKCVGIKERDGELIDKYICPNCTREGFITTWKRMCRRQGCRKPARVKDDPPSKYCSVECGRKFFVELIQRSDPNAMASKDGQRVVDTPKPKKYKKKVRKSRPVQTNGNDTPQIGGSRPQTPAYSEEEKSEYETDSSLDEDQLPNRGGSLRTDEVKWLNHHCRSIEAWRALGKKPETPPRDAEDRGEIVLDYDDWEKERMSMIRAETTESEEAILMLNEREKMLELIKARSATIADDIKKSNPKLKEVCGYDPRITWNESEFARWYNSEGKHIIDSGKIGLPPESTNVVALPGNDGQDDEDPTKKGGVCIRNRCSKHGSGKWQKHQLAEIKFEQDLIKKKLANFAKQEHEIRGRAHVRALENRGTIAAPTVAPVQATKT